jgi:DNA polymerase-3 subunit chi
VTQILFYHGTADRLQAALCWLHEAWGRRGPTLVYAPRPETAEQLDRLLWLQPPGSFLPHCRAESPLAGETPVVIAEALEPVGTLPHDERILNLSDELPPGFARFRELIEIVSTEDSVRLPARERFRFYRERGYAIESTDIASGNA